MSPADARLLGDFGQRVGVELSAEAVAKLGRYLSLLLEWNQRVRLTGTRDEKRLVSKHLADCLAPALHLPVAGLVMDIGSGAGLPGLVLAAARPDTKMILVEPRRRPATFLREAVRHMPLSHVRIFEGRAEEAAADPTLVGKVDVVVSRALKLETFLRLATPLLAPEGRVIAMQAPNAANRLGPKSQVQPELKLGRVEHYVLPDGDRRVLLVFSRVNE
jgi:16S rRNA (guanine527-N7)-methyltransferase